MQRSVDEFLAHVVTERKVARLLLQAQHAVHAALSHAHRRERQRYPGDPRARHEPAEPGGEPPGVREHPVWEPEEDRRQRRGLPAADRGRVRQHDRGAVRSGRQGFPHGAGPAARRHGCALRVLRLPFREGRLRGGGKGTVRDAEIRAGQPGEPLVRGPGELGSRGGIRAAGQDGGSGGTVHRGRERGLRLRERGGAAGNQPGEEPGAGEGGGVFEGDFGEGWGRGYAAKRPPARGWGTWGGRG